jgi:hypothetical protein
VGRKKKTPKSPQEKGKVWVEKQEKCQNRPKKEPKRGSKKEKCPIRPKKKPMCGSKDGQRHYFEISLQNMTADVQ